MTLRFESSLGGERKAPSELIASRSSSTCSVSQGGGLESPSDVHLLFLQRDRWRDLRLECVAELLHPVHQLGRSELTKRQAAAEDFINARQAEDLNHLLLDPLVVRDRVLSPGHE